MEDRTNDNSISLNKFISSTGLCSRREVDKMVRDGRVTLNGQPTLPGNRVFPGDEVRIDGQPLLARPQALYIAFNKPVGIVCTTDLKEPKNIISFINHPQRLFPIGRLDKDSQGLIFLTNDGDIVNKILRAGNQHEKEYIVTVNRPINANFISRMSGGLPILGTLTQACTVLPIDSPDKRTFKIILTQGLNRQIRRMCQFLGYEVVKLKRIRIMNVQLDPLKPGQWRELSQPEIDYIHQLVSTSSKTAEASVIKDKADGRK